MADEDLSDEQLFMSEDIEDNTEIEPEKVQEPNPQPEPEPTPEVQPVEEVAQANSETAIEPEVEPKGEDENLVPSWRVREINEAKRIAETSAQEAAQKNARLEAELREFRSQQQTQQQQPTPDVFEDQAGFIQHHQNQMQDMQQQHTMQNARLEAMLTHGKQEVDAAISAAMEQEVNNPALVARIKASQNPWGEAVAWHKEFQTQQEIGEGGIDGFRDRMRQELMADPDFKKQVFEELKASSGVSQTNIPETIPSLNKAPSVSNGTQDGRTLSEEELFLNS